MEEIFDIILSLDKRLNRFELTYVFFKCMIHAVIIFFRAEKAVSDLDTRITKYSLQVGTTKISIPANVNSSEMVRNIHSTTFLSLTLCGIIS